MIANVYGLYKFRVENQPIIYVMLMANELIKTKMQSTLSHKFDLKGSRISRQVLPKFQKLRKNELKLLSRHLVLKDEDFRFIKTFKRSNLINVSPEQKRDIMKALSLDTQFL